MPLYQITGPDGVTYEIEGPAGASRSQVIGAIEQRKAESRTREIQQRLFDLQNKQEKPETTIGGNIKEAFKGVVPGAVGLLETAGTGIASLLPEDTEKAAREKLKEIAGVAKKPFEAGAGYEDSVGRKLGEGLGSTLPFFLTGPLGAAGRVASGATALAAGAGEAREAAEAKGATGAERRAATLLGAPTGLLDIIAPEIGPMKSMITTALARGGVEGATEAAQKIAQNLIAKGVYDPTQPVLAGSGEEGTYGAGVGALASLILDMTVGRKARHAKFGEKPEAPTPASEGEKSAKMLALPRPTFTSDEIAAARAQDIKTSDPLAGLDAFTQDLARRGKEAALTEAFGQKQEPGQLGLPGIERADGTVEIPGRGRVQGEVTPATVEEQAAPVRDTHTRDMIDELETKQIEEMQAEDKSAELRKLIAEDKAKADKERLKFESDLAELDGKIKAKEEKTTEDTRLALLLPIVESDVKNIPKAFVAELKREGFTNANLTDRERALINRAYDLRLMEEPVREQEPAIAQPAGQAAELESAVPEKKVQREPEQPSFPGMGKPKGATVEAFSEEELASQEKPFATKLTADVLAKTGLPKQSGFYKQLLDMDMADPAQQPAVANIFAKVRTNPNVSTATKDAIENMAMQAFGGLAKQGEMFGPRGKVLEPTAKAKKATEKPAKEQPSETTTQRVADKGTVTDRAGARVESKEAARATKPAAGTATDTTRAEASKPTGVGDRGKPTRDVGTREKVEPTALKEKPKVEAKAETKVEPKAKVEKPAPKSDRGAYEGLIESDEKLAIESLAHDLYMATYPQRDVAKNLNEITAALVRGEMPALKFGREGSGDFIAGTGGKYAQAFYESLSPAQKDVLRKRLEHFFIESEAMTRRGLDWFNAKQLLDRETQAQLEENDELAREAVRVFTELHPQVIAALRGNKLADALRQFAGQLTGRNGKIARMLAKTLGDIKVEVVDDLRAANGRPLAGDFNPSTNTIRLDAKSGMNAHALLHEATHAAVHKILGNKSHPMTKQLTELFNNVKGSLDTAYGTKSLDEFVSEVFSNPEFQQKLSQINPKGEPISALRRFVNAVGNFLRSLVGSPTKGLDSAVDAADVLISQIVAPDGMPVGSLYQASMLGTAKDVFKAMDSRILSMPGMDNQFTGGVYEVLREKIPTATKNIILRSLPLNALTDVAVEQIPMAKELDTLEKRWGGVIDERRRAVDATMQRIQNWVKGNPDKETKLNDIISKSTLEEVDPSKPVSDYKGKTSKSGKDKQAVWKELQPQWDALGAEGQAIYKQMRDAYAESHEKLLDLLFKRIDASVADPAESKKLRDEIYQRLAVRGKIEPYFPLMRQGDYWVTFNAKGPDGQLEYYKMAFRTSVERERAIRELKADPNVELKSVQKSSPTGKRDYKSAPPTSFVNNILKVLKANSVDPNVSDEIMRVFLDTLPESSFAQSFRSRMGTLGFITNASQVFYSKSLSMAHQLANLEYSAKMYDLRDRMQKHVDENNRSEEARMLFDTMDRHIKSMVAPNIAPWSKTATSAAFGFTLGFNVSSAIVNTTQLPMVVMPYLGGKYGFSETTKAVGAATRLFFGSGLKRKAKMVGGGEEVELKAGYSLDNYDFNAKDLPQDIKDLRELSELSSEYGLLSRSMTSDVLESGAPDSALAKINGWSGFIFHHGERMNRQVSMIAAYRLELDRMRAGGKELTTEDRQAVAKEAIRLTELLNGGASANSAPLLAKSSLGKLMFMYKRYGVSMYYMLFKTTHDAMLSEDPQIRAAAKRQIAGVYASSALLAGVQGAPLFGIVSALYNLFMKGDDDDDFETAARKYMGEGMFNGALNYLTGTAVANRIGLTDLLLHDTGYRDQDNAILSFLQLVGGPVYGTADRIVRGAKFIMDGEVERGLEQMTPAAVGNLMKGYRFATEGANTLRGDPIVGDIGVGHSLAQAFGFAPAEYMRQLEVNANEKNIERRTLEKRTTLLRKYYVAMRSNDTDSAADYLNELIKLGQRHPGLVTPETIQKSMEQHMRTTGTMYHGVTLNKLMRNELLQNAAEYDKDVTIFKDEGE